MTSNTQAEMSQHPDALEQNQVGTDMAVDVTRAEIEDAQMEETTDVSTNGETDDPLSRFLPPPVTRKCSAALQMNSIFYFKMDETICWHMIRRQS